MAIERWRWWMLSQKGPYQVIRSTNDRMIPLTIECDMCGLETGYWRRKFVDQQSWCPRCKRLGVHI